MIKLEETIKMRADSENEAQETLLEMYQPLLSKEAIVDGVFDEDLYQELCFKFICCIEKFEI